MMKINKKAQKQSKQNKIWNFYCRVKQAYSLKKLGFYWLGAVLPAASQLQPSSIIINITKGEYYQLLHMLNQAVAEVIVVYKKSVPEQVYRFLHVSRAIFDLNPRAKDNNLLHSFRSVMYKVHFNSILALFLVKNKQFSAAFQCFQYVLEILKSEIVDAKSDIFLVTISNYLTVIKSYQYAQANLKLVQLINCLQTSFQNLLNRHLLTGCSEGSIMLLMSIYREHEIHLRKNFNAQNKLLMRKYEDIYKRNNRHVSQSSMIDHIFMANKKYRISEIEISKNEMNFFSISPYLKNRNRKSKMETHEKSRTIVPNQNNRIQKVMEFIHSININDKKQHKSVGQKYQKIIQTIDYGDLKQGAATKLQKSIQLQNKKQKKIYNKMKTLSMKINYTIIQVLIEGIVLSDFLREKRKFITWSEVFSLIKNFKFSQIFMHCLPVCCFYDVCKMLSCYIYKNDQYDKLAVVILDTPKQLVELSVPVKLFHIGGMYLKAFMMNSQDEIELVMDWYLQEFQKYFKVISHDEYIQKLNNSIFKKQQQNQRICSIQSYKKRDNVKQRLSQQLKLDNLLKLQKLKDYGYKIILFMPNNKQILIGYLNNNQQNIKYLQLDIIQFNNDQQIINKLYVPLYKIMRYFVVDVSCMDKWLGKFGKYVVEAYLQSFKDYPNSFNNLQCCSVITYAKKIEMTKIGKYMTPVIAEVVGSKTRIWGLCVRFYEISAVKQQITFIYNPYYQLLSPLINLKEQQRKTVLTAMLHEGSVAKSHKKLGEYKLNGSMVNLVDYWSMINF